MYWIGCYREVYIRDLYIYGASKVQKSKNRFVRADVLFAELASDFGGELVVGGGPFREPPTVMQSTVLFTKVPFTAVPVPGSLQSCGAESLLEASRIRRSL